VNKSILTKSIFAALLLASSVVTAEEQYPAADFQPTVIYSETESDSKDGAASSESATSSEASESVSAKAEEKDSSQTYLLGLVVLAVAGGFFLSKKPKCKAKKQHSQAVVYSADTSGLTGVERYLQEKNKVEPTGVARYLAAKEAADQEASVTGVEKYLRDRG
jgi:hypothetical protein